MPAALPLPTGDLARRLIQWYGESARDLPWRRTGDPYAIWVSEVMLQQTQVGKVLPYYERFLARFPAINHLAAASEDEVLGLWSGLGYYSRARNLHRAARRIVQEHGGRFPHTLPQALELPGVGRYTAGAVLSLAYDRPLPVLDGNVRRLMARLLALDAEPGGGLDRILWELLEKAVARPEIGRRVSEFNQALMELGALVCRPASPDCGRCPVVDCCLACRAGLVGELPRPRRRRATEELHFISAVIRRGSRFLMLQSRGEPYLEGFWEFPRVARPSREPAIASRFAASGLQLILERSLAPVRHHITYRRIFFHPVVARLTGEPSRRFSWRRPADPRLPTSSYIGKILAAVNSGGQRAADERTADI